jgi:hypothetical protein
VELARYAITSCYVKNIIIRRSKQKRPENEQIKLIKENQSRRVKN